MNRSRTTTTAAVAAFGLGAAALIFSLAPVAVAGNQSSSDLPAYEVTTVQLPTGQSATVKYSPMTGQAWVLRQDRLIPIVDEANLPQSHYTCDVTCSPNGRWSAVRLDTNNGNLWHIQDGTWIELNEIGTPVSSVPDQE